MSNQETQRQEPDGVPTIDHSVAKPPTHERAAMRLRAAADRMETGDTTRAVAGVGEALALVEEIGDEEWLSVAGDTEGGRR